MEGCSQRLARAERTRTFRARGKGLLASRPPALVAATSSTTKKTLVQSKSSLCLGEGSKGGVFVCARLVFPKAPKLI